MIHKEQEILMDQLENALTKWNLKGLICEVGDDSSYLYSCFSLFSLMYEEVS